MLSMDLRGLLQDYATHSLSVSSAITVPFPITRAIIGIISDVFFLLRALHSALCRRAPAASALRGHIPPVRSGQSRSLSVRRSSSKQLWATVFPLLICSAMSLVAAIGSPRFCNFEQKKKCLRRDIFRCNLLSFYQLCRKSVRLSQRSIALQ